MLTHVPGITKKDGYFEVFGKGAPLIYINGRLMRDVSELDQLKSENIKSVELITNPGAKYDASVKAVVKIRTKAAQGEGFGFDVRSSYYQSENTMVVLYAFHLPFLHDFYFHLLALIVYKGALGMI